MSAATPDKGAGGFLDRIRQLLRRKGPISGDDVRRAIESIDEDLAVRPAKRAALERGWADALLEATVDDQRAHRGRLEQFDLETEQAEAARKALEHRLEEILKAESEAAIASDIRQAIALLGDVDQDAREIDQLAEQLAARYAAFLERQRVWGTIHARFYAYYARSLRGDPEALAMFERWGRDTDEAVGAVECRRFFADTLLVDRRSFALERIMDEHHLWPPIVTASFVPPSTPHGTEIRIG